MSQEDDKNFYIDATTKYLKEIGYRELMSEDEERCCAIATRNGCQKSLNKMIECNLRLVIKVARKYRPKGAISFLDIISEGNLGLIRAAQKFDPVMGYRFSTYAVYWIRDMIERAIMNLNRTIRIPIPTLKELNIYNRAYIELKQQLFKDPTSEEVADFLDRPVEDIKKLLSQTKDSQYISDIVPEDEIMIEDMTALSPEESVSAEQIRKEILSELMEPLNENQRKVLAMRYGLNNYREHKSEECIYELRVSQQRICQIESEAIAKIKRTKPEITSMAFCS